MWKKLLWVGIGGFLGTWCRYGLNSVIPDTREGLPVGILMINLAGCLFLGWFLSYSLRSSKISGEMRLLIGTGFTGSFTTFSAFTVDTMALIQTGNGGTALLYVLMSTAGGLIMSFIGVWLGQRMSRQRKGEAG